jgi:Flp pilus assembly protein TadG
MKPTSRIRQLVRGRTGATAAFVALIMVVLLGVAALAIDIGFAYVVRGELQNAADAGALAGAQVLYINNGTQVNVAANGVASNYVTQHTSEQAAVTVESVERGHWSFATRTFTPNEGTLDPVDLWDVTTAELDADPNFINAVRVITTRTTTNGQVAAPFFASIFGGTSPLVRATAVAYIGFAGTLQPGVADQPIAICRESLLNPDGSYTCNVGRMITSAPGNTTSQSGGWTNLAQPCSTANVPSVRPLVCSSGNPQALVLGDPMGTVGGELQTVADQLRDCWFDGLNLDTNGDGTPDSTLDTDGDGWPDQPWGMTLPVIRCDDANPGPCNVLVGAVEVNVVWITRNDKNQMNEVPRRMGNWSCPPGTPGADCWASFVQNFGLRAADQSTATYEDKTIYFLPDCTPHVPVGRTGGENYGILAQIPVLVR